MSISSVFSGFSSAAGKLSFIYEKGSLQKAFEAKQKRIASAATAAMRDVTTKAKLDGRATIAAAGFSTKWQNALQSRVYPDKGESINAAGIVYHKIRYSGIFEHGGKITGKPFLWLPTENVPAGARLGGRLTPEKFIARFGALTFIPARNGHPPMLGFQKLTRRGKTAQRGEGAGQFTVMFIGIPAVNMPKKFGVVEAVKRDAKQLGAAYIQHIKEGK